MIIKMRIFALGLIIVLFTGNLFSQEITDIIIKKDYYVTSINQILKELGRTHQLYIDYDFEDVRGMTAPSQRYNMPLEEFLAAIFEGKISTLKLLRIKL